MKKLIICSILTLLSVAQADDSSKAIMKSMGEQFKAVALAIQSQSIDDDTLANINGLQKNIGAAALISPELATTDALKLEASQIMWKLLNASIEMEEVVLQVIEGDTESMGELLPLFVKMNDIRKEGHTPFKPAD